MSKWTDHIARWKDCARCGLCEGRSHVVLARGNVPCDILFIGEAPGESEDSLGRPFIGPAGKLLDRIIDRAVAGAIHPGTFDENGDNVAIKWAFTNLVACIPRDEDGRKTTEPDEAAIKACAPRLREFVRLCRPQLIVRVGKLAAKGVHGQADFSDDRVNYSLPWIPNNKFLQFVDITHPAAILRANVTQQDLMVQRCVVDLKEAIAETFF